MSTLVKLAAIALGIASAAALACGGTTESVKDTPSKGVNDAGLALLGEEEKLGETRDIDMMTEDGVIIRGVFRPSPVRKSSEDTSDGVVLLVHQMGSTRSEWVAVETALADTHSVLSIDLRGHGASTLKNDGTTIDREAFTDSDWQATVLDVRAAVIYLKDLQPPPSSITVVGSSIGSSAALLYAVEDPDVTALVMLSPGLDYRGMKTKAAMQKLGDRPVLALAATGDKASAKAARALAQGRKRTTAVVFKGEGHGVSMSGPLVPELVEFVKRTSERP